MANRFAVASGNFNDTATWSTTAAGASGASVPVSGDNAIANNRTVTITADATCDNLTNGTTYGGTAGGGFVLNNGVTLTANLIQGIVSGTCVQFSGVSPNSAAIVGTITGGGGTVAIAVTNSSTGSLNITGNSNGRAFANTSNGTLNIVGNCTAIGGSGSTPLATNSTGVINITGNCTGGVGGASHCVSNGGNGSINITGNVTGGSVSGAFGVNNTSSGQVTVVGDVTATAAFAVASTSATVRASGSLIYAIDGTVPISAPRIIFNTTPATAKTRYALNGTGTYVDMFTADNGLTQAVPADVRSGTVYADGNLTGTLAVPAAGSVALGVPVDAGFGSAVLTPAAIRAELATELGRIDAAISSRLAPSGTLATVTTLTNAPSVPSAATIASQVRTELGTELGRIDAAVSSRLAPSGTLATVTTLTNAPSVPSASTIASQVRTELTTELARIDAPISAATAPTASTVATAVRTELGTELGRIDATVSSRAATGTLATDVTAIRAKTDALVTDRLAQVSTVSTTGAQLAAALS